MADKLSPYFHDEAFAPTFIRGPCE